MLKGIELMSKHEKPLSLMVFLVVVTYSLTLVATFTTDGVLLGQSPVGHLLGLAGYALLILKLAARHKHSTPLFKSLFEYEP